MNLEALLTEQSNPASAEIDACPTAEVLAIINQRRSESGAAVAARDPANCRGSGSHRGAASRRAGGCSISAREPVAGWACWMPPNARRPFRSRRNWCRASSPEATPLWRGPPKRPKTTPRPGGAILTARGFTAKDALVGIAASGRTPYVLGAIEAANELGALTIGISCTPDSPLAPRGCKLRLRRWWDRK